MAVLKNKTQGHYVIIGMAPMQDQKLSSKERGLLFTIMGLPDNWEFSIAGLSRILPDGKDSIGNILKSLEEKGYLTRIQSRSEDGNFGRNIVEVHEVPVARISQSRNLENPLTENPITENPKTENPFTGNPSTENPIAEKPMTVNPYAENQPQSIIQESNLKKSDIYPSFQSSEDDFQVATVEGNYEAVHKEVMDRISYESLMNDLPEARDTIDLITEILSVVEGSSQEMMRINGEEKPIEVVRAQMKKINMFHVRYVLNGLESAGRIKNPTAYLLTSLYRSVFTMDMHIANQVENDMREVKNAV